MKFGLGRISTNQQDLRRQEDELTAYGCERLFLETWSSATMTRAGVEELETQLRPGDWVVVTELARAGRRPSALLVWLESIEAAGVTFHAISEAVTIEPGKENMSARMLLLVLAATAQYEKQMLLLRSEQGRVAAKARGVRFGRPAALDTPTRRSLVRAFRAGVAEETHSASSIARELAEVHGVSVRSVWRYVAEAGGKVTV